MMEMFFPPGASAHAAGIDRMVDWVHILMLPLFVGWIVYFMYVIVRFRKGRNTQADYRGASGKANKVVEIGVCIAEVILLVAFSIPLWSERVDAHSHRWKTACCLDSSGDSSPISSLPTLRHA